MDEIVVKRRIFFVVVARMNRNKANGNPRKKLVVVLVLFIVCAFFYLCTRKSGSSPLEYGGKSFTHFGSGAEEDAGGSSSKSFGLDGPMLKTFPVSYPRIDQNQQITIPANT